MADYLSKKKKIILWATTLGVALATLLLGQCEPLRRIKGTHFLLLWPLTAAAVMLIAVFMLNRYKRVQSEHMQSWLQQYTITHTEIPHLLCARSLVSPIHFSGYYLLRLYLRGIVTCKVVTEELNGQTQRTSRLYIDEKQLEKMRLQGGRHSVAAGRMVDLIRRNPGCSITTIWKTAFIRMDDPCADEEMIREINRRVGQTIFRAAMLLQCAAAFAYGLGLAKFALGVRNEKNVMILLFLLFFGFFALWAVCRTQLEDFARRFPQDTVWNRFLSTPHRISPELIEKVNTDLPVEMERNRLLNAYFYDAWHVLSLGKDAPEDSFTRQFAIEYQLVMEALRAEAEARAREASLDSGCTSCSSCSSCGGCGGCGGCGD